MKLKLALTILAALAFTASAQAKFYVPKHGARCKTHYVKHTVRIAKRHHGKLVRSHHKIVMVKQARCVYVAAKKPTTTTAPVPTASAPVTTTAPLKVRAGLDPTFTQDPADNLKVTWDYSASSSNSPLPDGTLSLTVQEPNKAGSSGGCTMNVGGSVTGGACTQDLPHYGSWNVTVTYSGASASVAPASQTETENIEPLPSSPSVPTTSSVSLNYGAVTTDTGPPPLNFQYEHENVDVSLGSSDPNNAGMVVSLTITNGTASRTLTQQMSATGCFLEFSKIANDAESPNTNVSGCVPDTMLQPGDTLSLVAESTASPGYLPATSPTVTVTPPWTL